MVATNKKSSRNKNRQKWPGVSIGVILTLAVLLTLFSMIAAAAPITLVDDQGADDEPGQKDLNFLTVDYAPVDGIDVTWGWDNTAWSGNNTGDACTLFDVDSDGFANYSLCITVDKSGQYLAT